MGTFEFSIYMIVALFALFALAVWSDDDAMHEADHDDRFHMHKPT
jgi:hypothetical protein